MKKFLLFGGAALMLSLASCSSNDYENNQTIGTGALNLITNLSDGSTVVSEGSYAFKLKITSNSQTGTITVDNLIINNNNNNFTTEEQTYETNLYDAYFKNPQTSTAALSNATFLLTPFFYVPQLFPGLPVSIQTSGYETIAQYTYNNNYQIKTFQKNTFFVGKTSPYPSTSAEDEVEDIYYMLAITLSEKGNTASIFIFNLEMPNEEGKLTKMQFRLENLDVVFSSNGIQVSGTDVVPGVAQVTSPTVNPDESYIFNNISFSTTSDDLTKATINYQIAGKYSKRFTGAYADTDYRKK